MSSSSELLACLPGRRFGTGRLTLFSLPALPAAAMLFPLGAYLPPFYAAHTGLSLAATGLVFTLARLWDIVTDPLVGTLSDRTRTRFGRRRAWLVASIPVLCLGLFALFFPPDGVGGFYLTGALLFAFVGFTMLTITHYAWGADLARDEHDRSRFQGAIVIMGIFGTLVAMILPALVEGGAADPIRARVEAMGAFALVTVAPVVLFTVFTIKDDPGAAIDEAKGDLRADLASIWRNRRFVRLLGADFAQGVAGGMLLSTFVFFSASWLGLPDRAGFLLLAFFAAGVVFVPGWLIISKRIGKARAIALSSAVTIPTIAAIWLTPPGSLGVAIAAMAAFGSTMGVWIFLTRSIVADFVAEAAPDLSRRPTGTYFAVTTLTTKLGQALAVGVAYALLPSDAGTIVSSGARDPIVAAVCLIPPVLGHVVMISVMLRHSYESALSSARG